MITAKIEFGIDNVKFIKSILLRSYEDCDHEVVSECLLKIIDQFRMAELQIKQGYDNND